MFKKKLNGHCNFRRLTDKYDVSEALCLLISFYYNYMSLRQKTFDYLSKVKEGTPRKKLLFSTCLRNCLIPGSVIK